MYMGNSPILPLYRPQKVSKYNKVVYNYLSSVVFKNRSMINLLDEIPLRVCVSPGWASQQKEFQIFCNPTREIKSDQIFNLIKDRTDRLKLPIMEDIEPIDVFIVGTNKDASPPCTLR